MPKKKKPEPKPVECPSCGSEGAERVDCEICYATLCSECTPGKNTMCDQCPEYEDEDDQ